METVKFILSALFLVSGVCVAVISTIGVFKFKYSANRMHAAALGDTFGILLCLLGVAISYGFSLTTLKVLLIVAFLWIASPVSSHLISKLIKDTDASIDDECERKDV